MCDDTYFPKYLLIPWVFSMYEQVCIDEGVAKLACSVCNTTESAPQWKTQSVLNP